MIRKGEGVGRVARGLACVIAAAGVLGIGAGAARAEGAAAAPAASAVPAAPAPPAPPTQCHNGLWFVGEVESPANDPGLGAIVGARVTDGLRFGLSGNGKARVASFEELKLHKSVTLPSMKTLRFFFEDMATANQLQNIVGNSPPQLSAYVQTTLVRTGEGVSASIALYCLPENKKKQSDAILAARKFVQGFGPNDAGLLDRVFAAAQKLALPGRPPGEAGPVPRVVGGTSRVVPTDTTVVIDASPSRDEDDDEFVVQWTCAATPQGASPNPAAAPPDPPACEPQGSKLRFTASAPGTYTITLHATRLNDPGYSRELQITVRAVAPVRLTVHDSHMVTMSRKTSISLEGRCEGCDRWSWTEIAGPVTTDPPICQGSGADAKCSVAATTPGEYTFVLYGENALNSDKKEETVGAAPRVRAAAYLPDAPVVEHSYKLDAAGSYDSFGGALHYHWEVSRDSATFADAPSKEPYCGPVDAPLPPGARLSAPMAPATEFAASELGPYFVRLTVISDRRFNGQMTPNQECVVQTMNVEQPTWLPFLVGGADFLFTKLAAPQSNGFRLRLGTSVRWKPLPWWLAVHGSQTVIQTDPNEKNPSFGGGTSFGLAVIPNNTWQFYLAGFGRIWGTEAFGPELGGEVRIGRYLVVSLLARDQWTQSGWQVIGGSFIGGGLDL